MNLGKLGARGGFGTLGALGGASRDFPYPTFPKTILSQFRVASDVFGSATAAGTLADAAMADSPYGATAVQLTTNGSTGVISPQTQLSVGVNVNNGSIRVTYKPITNIKNTGSSLTIFELRLYSAASGSNYHKAAIPSFVNKMATCGNTNGNGRFQTVAVPVNEFIANGTGADLTSIKWPQISIRATTGAVIAIGDVEFVPNPRSKAALLFWFDDCYSSAHDVAFPLMQANPVRATGILCPGKPGDFGGAGVGGTNRLTAVQIQTLCNAGWQWGSQYWTTEDEVVMEGWTEAQRIAEWAAMRAYGRTFGHYRDTYDGSNGFGSPTIRLTKDVACRTTRRFDSGNPTNPPLNGETFPFMDPHNIICLNLSAAGGAGSPISTYVGYAIDQVIASKGVLGLGVHNDLAVAGETLDAFNYALGRLVSDAATIEPHTIRSLLAAYNGDTLTG